MLSILGDWARSDGVPRLLDLALGGRQGLGDVDEEAWASLCWVGSGLYLSREGRIYLLPLHETTVDPSTGLFEIRSGK